jgi:CBS domain-containing protein
LTWINAEPALWRDIVLELEQKNQDCHTEDAVMRAQDIMTTRVVTVGEDTSIDEIASLLDKFLISAVPVVDDNNRVVGMVSEGDLLRRHEIGTETRRGSWWLGLLAERSNLAQEFVKAHGNHARDVMTKKVITVVEGTTVSEIAEIFEKNHIKRVPVVRNGALVGLVSRANIVQQLASGREIKVAVPADDLTVRDDVERALNDQPWASIGTTAVTVNEGKVELWGVVESEAEREATRIALETISGVVSVEDYRGLRSTIPVAAY